ncbi:REST corepressor-like protein isoform X1 [Saccoglossus kowalevskii]|uniref:REST corepressor-like protein isoform X1 n=1 Tax=Saccoglossus kowalevskii TaxID=10224 RepID=A0ABM0N0H4_SACKO|nr:PREDICTED: REST corepressor-like protein isoform X1 [Saccoglossus kowalevskii]
MVMADRNGDSEMSTRNNGSHVAGASNGHMSDDSASSSSDDEHEPGMRVGEDYQAPIPEMANGDIPPGQRGDGRPEALLVWAPTTDIGDEKLDEYIKVAKEKYGYNTEQALGMLFWHRHDVDKSLADLPNFTPFPDEWTVEDKVLFEQAFSFHGKSFHRIRQMLPDKSISCLVRYYYSWKKTRTRTSLMDRQAKKLTVGQKENSGSEEPPSDEENVVDSDFDPEGHRGDGRDKHTCSNCQTSSSQVHSTPKGSLCNACYSYWRRTGVMRTNIGPIKNETPRPDRHNPLKSRRKPPRGMYLDKDDLLALNSPQGDSFLKQLDTELISLKKQMQLNKQILSKQKDKCEFNLEEYKILDNGQRINARWTNDELLIAVQAVRKYGRDSQAIADVVGNKNTSQVRSFFVNYRRRFNLDQVLEEYEAEYGHTKQDYKIFDEERINGQNVAHSATPVVTQVPPTSGNSTNAPPPPLLRGPSTSSPSAPATAPPTQPQVVHRPPPPLQQPSRFLQPPRSVPIQPPPLIRPSTAPSMMAGMTRGRPHIMGPLGTPPQLVGSQRDTPPHSTQQIKSEITY